ncbi:MAG: hypothetical protein JRD05_09280 [Deltaproteobacteria bacterium]|nr:hypothetical protein [Deltaproteobacteria bacterium]
MKKGNEIQKVFRFICLCCVVVFGFISIVGTGGGGGGGGGGDDSTTWYEDSDGDGYGNPLISIEAESQPIGYVSDDTDCDDTDQSIFPGATEICGDGIDQDCDGDDSVCIPTDGLIEYYPFNGNANDESGNGNHGTIYGNSVQFVTGLFDQAINFDNSSSGTFTVNDYVDLPIISVNELSVSHWVKFISGSSTSYDGCTYSIGEYPSKQFKIRIRNTGLLKGQIIINNTYYNTSEIDISDHEWHFITVTVNSDYMKIYHNGSEIDSTSLGFDLDFVDAFQQIALHRFSGNMSSRFTGELDNLRIYDRSLTPSEVSSLFDE